MCMEDVRLGREYATTQGTATVTATTQLLIQEDPMRTILIILPPASGTLWVGINNNLAIGTGLAIPSTGSPFKLDIKKEGTLCCHGWFAVHSVGGVALNWFEGRLERK